MMKKMWKEFVLIAIGLGSFLFLMSKDPISQNLQYHNFADQRNLVGISNFFDVMSNLPFLLVGALGIRFLVNHQTLAKKSWLTFFIGVFLVGPGSAYYHYNPNNFTLVWDRLPMTVGFMGLFSALLSEHIGERIEKFILIPFLLLGFFSVIYWHFYDDLRIYFWVQGAPLLMIIVILSLYKAPYTNRFYLLFALAFYILAKVTESNDEAIFNVFNGQFSGHSIKHLLAAVGAYFGVILLQKRVQKV